MTAPEPSESDRLLTTAEVAERYRVSRMTISRWVRDGKLTPAEYPGKPYRFRESDLVTTSGGAA